MRRIRTLAAVAAAALSIGVGTARAAHIGRPSSAMLHQGVGAVSALSVVPGDGRTEVVIALTGAVKVADFTIENPDRIVLDLSGARLNPMRAYDRRVRGGIRNIRMSQSSPSMARIVLDLDSKRAYTISQTETEVRVAVSGGGEFAAWSSSNDRAVLAQATPAPAVTPEPAKAEPPKVESSIKVEPPKTEPVANVAGGSLASTPPSAPVVPPAAPVRAPEPDVTAPRNQAMENPISTFVSFGAQQSQARRITITWEDAPIADVLASFAEYSGRTIVRGKAVTGTVSAEIKDQPWDVAMKAILDAHGLAATEENSGIIVVDSYENILLRQASEPLRIEMVNVNYVSAASLVETVKGLLSKDCPAGASAAAAAGAQGGGNVQATCIVRGNVAADSGTNTLIITEVTSRVPGLLQYIRQLDVRTPQVALKAKIISVSRTSIEQLGLSYDLGSNAAYFNNLIPRNRPNSEAADDREGRVTLGGEVLAGMGNASRKYRNGSALNLLFSTALGKYSLTAFLDALREQQLSDIQAEPSIVTLDNREAKMLVGEETPVRVIDAGAAGTVGVPARANVLFKETGIILTVTPHITSNRQIRMNIAAEQSELRIIGGDLGFTIPKRNATTQLLVADGETAVIGGLTQTAVTKNKSGIPLLSDLPLLGRLFSQTDTREEKRDLLILITPHIIDEGEAIRPPDNNLR
ncbi:MAG TPA: AMIN domain-containing protein [Gemmatimonadaceae bacterium]